jgi:peptide/nickel transport system substrate-binding protein
MNNPNLPTLYAWVPTIAPPAERYIFTRNPYFFMVDTEGNQLPYIDQVDLRVADPEVMNLKIIAGEPNFQASRPQAFKDMPLYMQYAEENEYNVYQWGDLQISEAAIWINQNTPDPVDQQIFQDVRFRRAMSVAINREKINQTLYSGMGQPTTATLPPVEARYYKEEYARAYTQYDPDQANRWLDEMGLDKRDAQGYRLKPDGTRATFVVEPPDNRLGMIDNFHMIVDDWKGVGIELIVKPIGRSLWNKRMRGGQMQLVGWPMGKAASETDLVPISTSSDWAPLWGLWYNTQGKSGIEPPQHIKDLQDVWTEILVTVDEKRKDELYAKILQANADNVWVIGVVGPVPKPIIAKKWLHNVNPNGVWSYHHGHFVGNTQPYAFWIEKEHQ